MDKRESHKISVSTRQKFCAALPVFCSLFFSPKYHASESSKLYWLWSVLHPHPSFFFDKSIRIQVCVPTFAFRHILNLQCCCFDPFSLIFCLLWRLLRIAFVEVAMTTMYRINTFNMGKENGTDSLI